MKIIGIELLNIRSFSKLECDFRNTKVFIGQNDHGKSSILKVLNLILNEIDFDDFEYGAIPEHHALLLLPAMKNSSHKEKRIVLKYLSTSDKVNKLYLNLKSDFSVFVHTDASIKTKSEEKALKILSKLRELNKFILIPAIRDTKSFDFETLLTETLETYGLSDLTPSKRGGTVRGYRTISKIREEVTKDVKSILSNKLFPALKEKLGIKTNHQLSIVFDVDIPSISEWIKDNIKLSFEIEKDTTIPLLESGTGVQSAILLALQQLKNEAKENPQIQYFFAIEEPEAFLHPHKQKELYQNIKDSSSTNLNYIITTHSPFIVSNTKFSEIGIVRKDYLYSNLYFPDTNDTNQEEIYEFFSNEINSQIFFAEKVIFVEGESDKLALEALLKKHLKSNSNNISIIPTGGNRNFSPYINLITSYKGLKIPFLILTDFDSVTSDNDRALFTGIKKSKLDIKNEKKLIEAIDKAIQSTKESEHRSAATLATKTLRESNINAFILPSDLEYSLVSQDNLHQVCQILNRYKSTNNSNDYTKGFDLITIKRQIGSKGIPFNPMEKPQFKRPYVHKKIAESIDLNHCNPEIKSLLDAIDSL
ncbi:ATP-dependent nuclease [Leptospira idonii]|uniref:DUF2813 domain-containing protein n=1 Tax=Leptospira idonii TaxID=1193500 RepID=A0A4R9M0U8_9LEPT|nr:AAA family ATPase [Leptospira idonii]TGN18859.1 DUF2813 domain-containing protein [Leptospira idonii]